MCSCVVFSLDFRVCDLILLKVRAIYNVALSCLYAALLYPIGGGHHFGLESILAQRRRDQRVTVAVWTEQADAQRRQMAERRMADWAAGGDAFVAATTERCVTL